MVEILERYRMLGERINHANECRNAVAQAFNTSVENSRLSDLDPTGALQEAVQALTDILPKVGDIELSIVLGPDLAKGLNIKVSDGRTTVRPLAQSNHHETATITAQLASMLRRPVGNQ